MGSDLLKKFSEKTIEVAEKGEEIELNLGLSLGGCFGGKPKESGLYRSSSNACMATIWRDGGGEELSLTRTSSLPSGSLEETKKRKGLMEVIQMEVMKKELEKKKCCRDEIGVWGFPTKGLNGSQGSGSSGVTELDSQSAQVLLNPNTTVQKRDPESSSPTSVLSSPEQPNAKTTCPKPVKKLGTSTKTETDDKKAKSKASCTNELGTNVTDEMPHVFTKGEGPNGRRVEGFLFKYKKGEDIRIMCVCHGSFLTPAEFVKHAGGNEVAHPLRRIVVVSPSSVL